MRFYSSKDNGLSEAICLPLLPALLTADRLILSFFAGSVADQSPSKTGRYGLKQPFRHVIDKAFSAGIVTEDVAPFDPSADDVQRCGAASMRAFRGMSFYFIDDETKKTRKLNTVPLLP